MTQQPRPSDPVQAAKAAYEAQEKQASKALEELVSSQGFAEGLAMVTSNVAAMARIGSVGLDQVVRMTRLAGRSDIARLGRQLARTEDKLEQVLQVVELLEAELALVRAERDAAKAELAGQTGQPGQPDQADVSDDSDEAPARPARRTPRNGRAVANSKPRVARSASAAVADGAKSDG